MTVLFIPGFMADQSLWDDLLPHLEALQQDFAFAALDRGDTVPALAASILAGAPDRFILVGFSMGGYVAREIARAAPSRVLALVLIATSARADTPEQVQRKASATHALASAAFRGLGTSAIKSSVHPCRRDDREFIERVRSMSVRLGQDVFLLQAGMPREGDLHLLSEIACPTLVVAAEQDELRSMQEARELADGIPGAEMVLLGATGHMVPMEVPEALGCAIREWFSRLPAGAE